MFQCRRCGRTFFEERFKSDCTYYTLCEECSKAVLLLKGQFKGFRE